ncbi:MAG: AmmeMemoRadiSam system radical SAM enzyme [Thermodesulfobacteriota bacterium]
MNKEREASLYTKRDDKSVDCQLCAFRCHIKEGRRGICGVRENQKGVLKTLVYGTLIAENIDPIEKKPLFHFHPSSTTYSIATAGCNFRCLHCQNYDISQAPRESAEIPGHAVNPKQVVQAALGASCDSVSYTYTEPTIFFEFARDAAVLAKEQGLKNIFVTNGFMTTECLGELDGVLDAANVDIKAFTEGFYKKVCGARLAPVLESIVEMRRLGIWVEVTTLIIPGLNNSPEELRELARWIYKTDKSMPWHISAFYPTYKLMDAPPTTAEDLIEARDIGLEEGLRYVYTGNIPGLKGESTYCYNCGRILIERQGYRIGGILLKGSACSECGAEIDGVWS